LHKDCSIGAEFETAAASRHNFEHCLYICPRRGELLAPFFVANFLAFMRVYKNHPILMKFDTQHI